MKLSGHASVSSLMRYSYLQQDEVLEIALGILNERQQWRTRQEPALQRERVSAHPLRPNKRTHQACQRAAIPWANAERSADTVPRLARLPSALMRYMSMPLFAGSTA